MRVCVLIFGLITLSIQAQTLHHQAVHAGGGTHVIDHAQTKLILSSVGQMVQGNGRTERFTVQQGFQQNQKVQVSFSTDLQRPWAVDIYPNPSEDLMFLEFPGKTRFPIHFSVQDLRGRNLFSGTWKEYEERSISLGSYPQGNYIIRVWNSEKETHLKVIKL